MRFAAASQSPLLCASRRASPFVFLTQNNRYPNMIDFQPVLGLSQPPRRFASRLSRWLFLVARPFSSLSLGILLGLLVVLPLLFYQHQQQQAFDASIKAVDATATLTSAIKGEGSAEFNYMLLYKDENGIEYSEKTTHRKAYCDRIGCTATVPVFYSSMTKKIYFKRPNKKPLAILKILLPFGLLAIGFLIYEVQKQRKLLPLLYLGIATKGILKRANKKNQAEEDVLVSYYEYDDHEGGRHYAEIPPGTNTNNLPREAPVLYFYKDSKTAIVYNVWLWSHLPEIRLDGLIVGISFWAGFRIVFGLALVLLTVWFSQMAQVGA